MSNDNKSSSRSGETRRWRPLLTAVLTVIGFTVLSWIYFFPNDVNGDVLRQHDVMQGVANGREGVLHEAATGEITRWTDALFGGMPTYQIRPTYSNTQALSVVQTIYTLGMPEPVSWVFMLLLGFFILLLAFDVKWYLAVLGAVGYAFSSYYFILMGAGHIWKLLTLAYIPPTLAGIVWAYRGRVLGGAAVAALFAALQLMSNHVQMTYYSMLIVIALAVAYLVKAVAERRVGRWLAATGALAVAAVLAVAANAPNLYLTYKYSQETIRGGHSELAAGADQATRGGLDKDYITQWSYGIGETLSLLVPNVKGGATIKPEKGENRFLSLADTPKAQRMVEQGEMGQQEFETLSQFPQYFGDQPMTNGPVYVGALIFALCLLGCAVTRGPVKWALVAATLLSVLLSWGHNAMWLTGWMIDHFPMYNKFRTPASLLIVAEVTMPLLAVLGLHTLLTDEEHRRDNVRALWASLGVSAALCLVLALMPGVQSSYSAMETEQLIATGQLQQYPTVDAAITAVRNSLVSGDAWRSLLVLALGTAALWLWTRGRVKAPALVLMLAAVTLIDMYVVDKRYINADSFVARADVGPETIAPRPVDTQILQDTTLNYRVLDRTHFTEAMPSYFHKTVGGYHAAKLTRYNDLIERQIANGNMGVLNMLNTRYVILDDRTAQLNPDALGNAWLVDSLVIVDGADAEMAALDSLDVSRAAVVDRAFAAVVGPARAIAPGDTIRQTTYAPNRLTYRCHTAQGGLAVFSEIYFPWGWQVTIDGKPATMGRVNYVLRALQLPPGDHTIVMAYEPAEVRDTQRVAAAALTAIAAALLLALNLAVFKRRKARGATSNQSLKK